MAQPPSNSDRIVEEPVESNPSHTAQHGSSERPRSPGQAPPSRMSDPPSPTTEQFGRTRSRTNTSASMVSSASNRLRSASIKLMESDAPLGMWAAAGSAAAKAPTIGEIRRGSFRDEGWSHEGQLEDGREKQRRASLKTARRSSQTSVQTRGLLRRSSQTAETFPQPIEEVASGGTLGEEAGSVPNSKSINTTGNVVTNQNTGTSTGRTTAPSNLPPDVVPNEDGYYAPPKVPWTTSWSIGLRAFIKWVFTPVGFLITLYCCNVVAWGGMLFLLLCNASKAMCKPTCNDINSPRRIWIEIDSQVLNGLFCVTGFGTIPWRFRDLYWLLVYRLGIRGRSQQEREVGIRRLAGIHRGWFRLRGSENWLQDGLDSEGNPAVPLPLKKRLEAPLTGVRAEPTATWKMDFVVWANAGNTFLQACLCGFMWGYTRYTRPSWATGFFIAIACVVAAAGGLMMFHEGKKIKKVEGVPPKGDEPVKGMEADIEMGGKTDLDSKRKSNGSGPTNLQKATSVDKSANGAARVEEVR